MTNQTKLKRIIDKWYSKQIDCLDVKKEKESKAELFMMINEILSQGEKAN